MDFLLFKRSFEKAELLPVYVVYGEEAFFIHEAVSLIRSRILGKEETGVSLTEIGGAETSFPAVVEELETVPFFGTRGKRLVVVYGADKLVAHSRDKLQDYMESSSPFGYLVLVCNELDRRTSFFNKLNRKGGTVACRRIQDAQLLSWITSRAQSYEKQISLDACNILAENVGNSLSLLAGHIEKLVVSVGRRREIRPEDVEGLVGADRQRDVFELTGAVARKDFPKALKILAQLLRLTGSGEEVVKVIPPLRWQIGRLWRARRILNGGGDKEALTYSLGVPRRYVDDLVGQTKLFSEKNLERDYRLLLEADLEGKVSSGNNKIILEKLIFNLCK
ncbi:MAG: DNA polymerase III subunit delta [Planctomycetes bacterium RIFCSPHIGHO2_02_FULL_50_42]|nr:MAG: DNA polymerase III subunit delta [Planctomycetes bacterium RIFCSPHIGHO2_02_FULL_50_42]OHB95815.1 MAG: DNA polymerase III subunit delta [Planctomycetes bacterium RIFCSPLOWO2_02_FULL_50_16]OHC02732.1 MAG: DNA polymerase III subunit delta [Planctomycetes bacterium RIFCSPLOWO2_12_FULL_50_35]HCN19269.1 DNA polymerase III subunit delta [Planctomycetia bacterium]